MFLWVCLGAPAAWAQSSLTAADIMLRVAANQDRANQLRKEYVYHQHIHVVSHMTNGRLMREETDEYTVAPTPDGSKKQLTSRTGQYWQKGKYVQIYGADSAEDKADNGPDDGIDKDLTEDFVHDLDNDKSKDGLGRDLFPLTTEEQKKYEFKLIGEAVQDGRAVYRIGFSPRDKNDYSWSGEALIDKEEFQPVLVFTKLSRKLPLLVRGALGTDLPGIGFSVHYRREPDGVWFPSSFGTEFRLKVLFFLKRDISLSLDNRDFKHTHVDSKITVAGSDSEPK